MNSSAIKLLTRTTAQNTFFYIIGFFAIGIYGAIIYQNTYNIPKWDDFPEIIFFLNQWLSADTLPDKFLVFISQTNEHILLVNHLIILLQYYLIGHLNFSWLIYIGNIFYIGSALTLWLFFKNHSERAYAFAIISITGITFYSYDSTLWAMTAISNQAVICFSFLAIYFVSKQKNNIPLAMLFSGLAVFSQSNGLLVLFIITGYFYILKEWKNFRYWLVFSITITALYIYWFNPATQQGSNLLSILYQLPLLNYTLTIPAFLSYLGGAIFTEVNAASIIISILMGIVVLTIMFLQFKKNQFSKPIILIIAFLLLSILSIAAYRGLVSGLHVAFISRYKMYGAYLLATGVLLSPALILKQQESKKWRIGLLSLSLIYFTWSFLANLPRAKIIDGDLFNSLKLWVEDGDFRRAKGFFVRDADSYLFSALKNNTYNPMVLLPAESIINDITIITACPVGIDPKPAITADLDIYHKNPNAAGIKVRSFFNNDLPVLVMLCSAEQSYQFSIDPTKTMANESSYFINRGEISPNTYMVFVKNGENSYQLEKPFINKVATR